MGVCSLSEVVAKFRPKDPYSTPLRWPGPEYAGPLGRRFIPADEMTPEQWWLAFHPNDPPGRRASRPFGTKRDPAREPWPES
jgi:hypothetical protein